MRKIAYIRNLLTSSLACLATTVLWAGIGPQNVVVVVNDNSTRSLELGQYYQDRRALAERQIVHVSTTTNASISLADFNSDIYDPVSDHIHSMGLSNQIDTILYTIDMPYQVDSGGRLNSITSVTYYGFKTYPDPQTETCSLPEAASNRYFEAESDFRAGLLEPEGIRYHCSVLSGVDMGLAKATVDRAITADHAFPTGNVYYVHSSDLSRNVHWPQFENSDFLSRQLNVPRVGIFRDADFIENEGPISGYMIGTYNVKFINMNTYSVGALGHHLTSYGGILFNTPASQMSILRWLEAGCAGSYGTVVEPCNFTEKFPTADVHFWYSRGFPMAESFYMSVESPYMGLVAGDPMCRPYAVAPLAGVGGVSSNQILSGIVPFSATGQAASADQRVGSLDLFLDDLFVATLTNVVAAAGEEITVDVDGTQASYTILGGDGISDIAAGMAAAIEANGAMVVSAVSCSDRVQLTQDTRGVAGAGITLHASVSGSPAPVVHATVSGSNLIESEYPASHRIVASGSPVAGNFLRLRVKLLDGNTHANRVFRQSGETIVDLMQRLADAVNSDPDLTGSDGVGLTYLLAVSSTQIVAHVVARTNGWDTYNINLDYDVVGGPVSGPNYDGPMTANQSEMSARGAVFTTLGRTNLTAEYQLDTTALADGPHTLRIVAYDGSAVRSQGHYTLPFVVDNHSLSCSLVSPAPENAFLEYQDVPLLAVVSGGAGSVTSVHFVVEGKKAVEVLGPPYEASVNLAQYGIGWVGVQARAFTDAGESAWSNLEDILILDSEDTDADSLPDAWELLYYPDLGATDGTGDSDLDNSSDHDEFVADTDPTAGGHYFSVLSTALVGDPRTVQVTFVSSPTRAYEVEANEDSQLAPASWIPASALFHGEPGQTTWMESDPVPAAVSGTVYRVRTARP